jgi:hypothetical protein
MVTKVVVNPRWALEVDMEGDGDGAGDGKKLQDSCLCHVVIFIMRCVASWDGLVWRSSMCNSRDTPIF